MAPSQKLVTLGVDIGSTNTKVVAVDRGGAVVGRRSRPTPRSDDGSIEPTLLLTALESLVLALASGRFAVAAIATAGVGEDGFLADPGLRPLTTALPWFRRAAGGRLGRNTRTGWDT